MKELTLKQKNDMIDYMVRLAGRYEEYLDFTVGVNEYAYEYFAKKRYKVNFWSVMNNLFPELLNKMFSDQSERIIYLLLVKEFIN